MPWDGTELWLADLAADGSRAATRDYVAGGPRESIFQPEWSPDGVLHFVSDRSGWWNLYRVDGDGGERPLAPMDAEFGAPQWLFGMSTYAFLADGRIACIVFERRASSTWRFVLPDGPLEPARRARTRRIAVACARAAERCVFVAGSPTEAAAVVRCDARSGEREVLRRSVERRRRPQRIVSQPRDRSSFRPTAGTTRRTRCTTRRRIADFVAPDGERPPLHRR